MDDKLIERLSADAKDWAGDGYIKRDLQDATTAIETLRADLARVTAERDALIKRTAGDCWSCIRRYECNSRKGPHRWCWEFDPWLLKED